jgi:hypothetical protein
MCRLGGLFQIHGHTFWMQNWGRRRRGLRGSFILAGRGSPGVISTTRRLRRRRLFPTRFQAILRGGFTRRGILRGGARMD